MNSRERILGNLRQGERPFPAITPPEIYRPMVPITDTSPAALRARFITEAKNAACIVHQVDTPDAALAAILDIIAKDRRISSWDPAHIPVPGLATALGKANIACVGQDAGVRVGLTGVDAALAAMGSVVVLSGNGRYRATSLLPSVHIAVVKSTQILPDLESWWSQERTKGLEQTRQSSNIVVITGPSRTADIAMQLVMGMHGPRELHIVLVP
jgi:L-lactate dehydrogenase complex protein LldG